MKPIILLLFIVSIVSLSTKQKSLNSSTLVVQIEGLKSQNGTLLLAIYNNKEDFPSNASKAYSKKVLKISNNVVQTELKNVPFGWYAIAVLHDENNNQSMDKNMIGIPKEGYGMSNNAHKSLGIPSWDDAKIRVENERCTARIRLKY